MGSDRKKIPSEWFNVLDYGARSGLKDSTQFFLFMCARALAFNPTLAIRFWFRISNGEASCLACGGASGVCEYVDELEFWLNAHAGVHADAVGRDRALAFEAFVGMRFPGDAIARVPDGVLMECWKEMFGTIP